MCRVYVFIAGAIKDFSGSLSKRQMTAIVVEDMYKNHVLKAELSGALY